jgi:hypothetical protein
MTPAIFRGGRFTTNSDCLPSIWRGIGTLALYSSHNGTHMIAEINPKCDQLFRIGYVAHHSIVPTRTSIWLRSSGEIGGFTCAGFISQF